MIDLDERLREDFAELTSGAHPDLGIDTDDLLGAGRRLARSRAVRRGLGGVAVAGLAAVLGWAGLAVPGASTAPVVPAAPVPSQAWIENPAYFDLTNLPLDAATEFRKVTLAVTPAATGWDVTADLNSADGMLLGTSTFHAGTEVTVYRLSPQVGVALLPTTTRWWEAAMKNPMENLTYFDSMRPGTLDVTAVLVVFDTAKQADDLAGFIWQAADGTLVDSLGNAVPTSTVTLEGRTVTVYRDAALKRFGYLAEDEVSFSLSTDRRWDWPAYPRLQRYERTDAGDTTVWILADLLPEGAHDLAIDLIPKQAAWTTTELAGRTAYVIVTIADKPDRPIRSVSYVDADGKTVSYHR